ALRRAPAHSHVAERRGDHLTIETGPELLTVLRRETSVSNLTGVADHHRPAAQPEVVCARDSSSPRRHARSPERVNHVLDVGEKHRSVELWTSDETKSCAELLRGLKHQRRA